MNGGKEEGMDGRRERKREGELAIIVQCTSTNGHVKQ